MRRIHAVGVIFEDENKNILVLKRHQDSLEGKIWGLVGGHVDENEDKLATAIREVKEETGHNITPSELKFIRTYHWKRPDRELTFDVFRYQTSQKNVDIVLDKSENTEHMWTKPKELHKRPDLMVGLYPILEDEYEI